MDQAVEYRFGNAQVRPHQRQLLVGGQPRQIGARAFDVLLTLIERRERVVRKNELIDCVWPGTVVEENNLQVHISSLRKLLGPQAIATIPGRGYRFTAELSVAPALDGAAAMPADSAAPRTPGNLPAAAPALYGRERELAQLRAIAAAHRLVTVVGAGGIGKSALALALAHELALRFPHGTWLVELAPLAEPSLVVASTAGVLRLALRDGEGANELARRVADRSMLIVLDNCEHLPRAASELAMALYHHAPQVRLLATSREPLKLVDEHVYRLGGLAVPAEGAADIRSAGSVALFEARAQAVDASFVIRDEELREAVAICRHLDGIPLAIEFAAARVPLLGVRGLREHLDDRFHVLTRGARLAQPRHQTLHAALEWSFALLDAEQQVAFRRLGVFAGSFGLDAAKRVGGGEARDGWRVLGLLGDLVDKSLIVAESGDAPRYRLLETTRAFALGKLADAGEVETARRTHAHAMLALFESSRGDEFTVPLERLLARYRADIDNLRVALDWAGGPNGDPKLLVELTSASAWIWRESCGRTEGMRRLQLAFDRIDAATPALVELRLCIEWGVLAAPEVGALEITRARRAVEVARRLGDDRHLGLAVARYGRACAHRGDMEEADRAIDELRALMQSDWPTPLLARCLLSHSYVAFQQGDYETSLSISRHVCDLTRAMHDELMLGTALVNAEQCAAALGRWQESVERGRELEMLIARDGSSHACLDATVAGNLCMALLKSGDIDSALQEARRALPLYERLGHVECLLESLAPLTFARGFAADAARMMGCTNARLAAIGSRREPVEQATHDALERDLAHQFTPSELRQLIDEGAALTPSEAASLVLREDGTPTPQASPGSSALAAPPAAQETHRARA